MGVYTSYDSASIDSHIASKLRLITKVILENVPQVKSIFLTGGFGKGEGSVKKTANDNIVCLRDFDIVVIIDRVPKGTAVQKLYDEIYQSLNLPNPEDTLFRFSNFVVDIKFLRKRDLIYPDIWFYDLKTASKLLYGEDIRSSIPWSKEDIPLSSGLRLLFEKVTGLLAVFHHVDAYGYGLKTEGLSKEKTELLIVECYKAFIEMCTALCILSGRYEPKYADRARALEKITSTDFPELAKLLPGLPSKVISCTNFKLKPDFTKVNENVVNLWFSTRYHLSVILRFYIERYSGINILDWENLPRCTKAIAWNYYKPFLNSLIKENLKFSNRILLNFSSFLYQHLTNLEYLYVVMHHLGRLHLRLLRLCYVSPSLKFFTAAVMILLSLNKDGTIKKELFRKAAEELRHCIPVETSTVSSFRWDDLKRLFQKAYSLYRGYHFVK